MPLMLTRRFVSTTSSLSSEIKSVPPAKTDASSQSEPRSPGLFGELDGFAYSNASFGHAYLFECAKAARTRSGVSGKVAGRARRWRFRRR